MGDEDKTKIKHHDLDQVWTRIDEMKTDWADTNSELSSVVSSVAGMQSEMREMGRDLRTFISRPQKETDYKSIIMIALSIAVMAGGLVAATIAPMNSILAKHDMQILKELEESANHRYLAGRRDGKLDAMEKVIHEFVLDTHSRLMTLEKTCAGAGSTVEAHGKQLDELVRSCP